MALCTFQTLSEKYKGAYVRQEAYAGDFRICEVYKMEGTGGDFDVCENDVFRTLKKG